MSGSRLIRRFVVDIPPPRLCLRNTGGDLVPRVGERETACAPACTAKSSVPMPAYIPERSVRFADRCLELAEAAPSERIRLMLLSIARLSLLEADLIAGSKRSIAESRELIARASALLPSQDAH